MKAMDDKNPTIATVPVSDYTVPPIPTDRSKIDMTRYPPDPNYRLQWNLSILDTLGTTKSVQYNEVSLFQRLIYTHLY